MKRIELISGESISVMFYSGVCDVEAMKKFERLKSLMNDHLTVEIPNSNGVKMSVYKVEMVIKEKDLEYNLDFCDVIVSGVIL